MANRAGADCPHCPTGKKGFTQFKHFHQLNKSLEVRTCLKCGKDSVHSSDGTPIQGDK